MKKDLFIKILKYTGVALIGAFVGIGALVGVSSCYSRNNKSNNYKPAIAEKNKHYRAVTSGELDNTKTYYVSAKNYANNGLNVFYQNSISLDNSAICGTRNVPMNLKITCSIIQENNIKRDIAFVFGSQLNGGVYKLSSVMLDTIGFIYDANGGIFNRSYCSFVMSNPRLTSGSIEHLYTFFNVYDLSIYNEFYDFGNAFNYNNFYQVNDTFYAQPYSPVVGVTTGNDEYVTTLNVGLFYSGGLVFDSIKVTFGRNYNNSYYFETAPNSNEYLQFPTNAVGAVHFYFRQMEYVNSATNFTMMACNRTSYTKNGTPYFQFLPAWASQDYKKLEFQNPISNLKTRSIFNSLSDTEQLNQPIITNNVGLSSAFSLLSMAFTAWLPIMNISIVPGITLGLLLFLPLIVGIIILVIWLVKR